MPTDETRLTLHVCVHDNELRERGFVKSPVISLTQTRAERWCRVNERAVRMVELRPGESLVALPASEEVGHG